MARRSVKMAFDLHKSVSASNQDPIIIMHGLLGCKRNWRSIARALNNKGFGRVYCVDARNHGMSPWSNEMNYKFLAEDLLDFISDLKSPNVSLIGHSMGGKASMAAALMEPSMIHRLVVVDIAPYISPNQSNVELFISLMNLTDLKAKMEETKTLHGLRARLMKDWKDIVPSAYQRSFILTNLCETNGEPGWSVNIQILHKNLRELVGFPYSQDDNSVSYKDSALFISGEKSAFLQPDQMPYVFHFFPNAKRTEIPGAGHFVNADAPTVLTDTITDFINHDN
nr:abhydrolase domain containing protein 11 [Hymenolepis microstoma]